MTLTTLITLAALTGALASIAAGIYAIPMRRTWRKEHDLPLNTPGPELTPEERASREAAEELVSL